MFAASVVGHKHLLLIKLLCNRHWRPDYMPLNERNGDGLYKARFRWFQSSVSWQLSDAAVFFSLVMSCIPKTPAALTVVFLLKYSVVAETLWWAAVFPLLSLDPKLNRPALFCVCLTFVPFLQMWRFTLERSVMRKEITSIIKVRSTRWLIVGNCWLQVPINTRYKFQIQWPW